MGAIFAAVRRLQLRRETQSCARLAMSRAARSRAPLQEARQGPAATVDALPLARHTVVVVSRISGLINGTVVAVVMPGP